MSLLFHCFETHMREKNQNQNQQERGSMEKKERCYCVTGANGYIGSWLVKSLLLRGFMVHATVRDLEKSSYLSSSWNGGGRLRLFRADLEEEGSFDEAVEGCDGVFHVAASMEFGVLAKDNIEAYVRTNIIDPAIRGTLNLLKSCLRSKSTKRVVFTSSISTITAKDSSGKWRHLVDESCQTPIDHVLKTKASGWVYVLAKLETEEAALRFANENKIDLVSIISPTIAGPFLTKTVPSSIRVLLSPITGEEEFYRILCAVNARMGSIALAHIEDICDAHIFLMEQARAEGRYICCAQTCALHNLVDMLSQEYPCTITQRCPEEELERPVPCEISSKKLRGLGFEYKHGVEDIVRETITGCVTCGFLETN